MSAPAALPPREVMPRAMAERDPELDGPFVVCGRTTRVFCRPTRLALLVSLTLAPPLVADEAGPQPLEVPTVAEAPRLDGELAEAAWAGALVVVDFVARQPVEGATPSVATEVRLVHTQKALYVGLRAYDPEPARIRATTMRRDDFAITEGDQFVIAIDSFRDRRNGYWFSTNPLGARVDAQFSDEGERFEDRWNGLWDAAARIDAEGWTAELEIPWSTLRFRGAPEVVMGINLFRRVPHTYEQLFAPALPLVYAQGTPNVSAARPYRFRGIRGGARLDLRPFALVAAERSGAGTTSDVDAGLFLRAPLSDAVTLAATYRADFSEAEADDTQLNLTRFPLFLPEKRDFFLDGAGYFAFGAPGEAELFFSRTIGFVSAAAGASAPIAATTVPIEWGAKATGSLGRLELGALAGELGDAPGAPSERFEVARARLAVGGRGYAGGFWSRRHAGAGRERRTAGIDLSYVFPREVRLQGFAARDSDPAGGDDAWFLSLARGGDRATFTASVLSLGAGFSPAVGLLNRPGTRRVELSGVLPWFPAATSRVRRHAPGLGWVRYDDERGDGFDERWWARFETSTKADDRLELELSRRSELLTQEFSIYRDVVVPPGRYDRWEATAILASNPARRLSGQLEVRGGGLYGGDHLFARLELAWRPSRFLGLTAALLADRVDLEAASFTAWVARMRLAATASPRLRLDFLAQVEGETRSVGAGVRARYDFREGTEVVLAWDSVEMRDPLPPAAEPRRRNEHGAAKVSYFLRW